MKIAVKFCGGCNPRYDRGALLRKLKNYYDDRVSFENLSEEKAWDAVLVIAGCPTACVEIKSEYKISKVLLVREYGDLSSIIEEIDRLLGG